ncbi:hypothetical protein SAMN03080598_03046 [Algoriphagus boritolerans DSM 17298 = JCM 18970]|uniref:Uncharacterized protein n=1 Tax=Algoriphagus boritolerans DSM 17298 = JCM 18970 TaxID=1120964 RepID=A0A1H5YKD5_9BACT|nr:hypothetical protein SAMN03080598_03046 [Algoriphagus boritolerans DSM 17298 = JCM 18970]
MAIWFISEIFKSKTYKLRLVRPTSPEKRKDLELIQLVEKPGGEPGFFHLGAILFTSRCLPWLKNKSLRLLQNLFL